MTTDCPACTTPIPDPKPHCTSPTCQWLTCPKCGCRVADGGTYYGPRIWGNPNGYIKAD